MITNMPSKIKKAVFLSAFILVTANTIATNFYVKSSGSNSYNGLSADSAWSTIDTAASRATAGDTVFVAPGSYFEQIVVDSNGSSGNPVVFLADVNGDIFGIQDSVIVNGSGIYSIGFIIDSKSYILIDGFSFDGQLVSGVYIESNDGNAEASNNIVQNCYFTNWNVNGSSIVGGLCIIRNSASFKAKNNEIRANTFLASGNATIGILICGTNDITHICDSNKIYKNDFIDNDTAIYLYNFVEKQQIYANTINGDMFLGIGIFGTGIVQSNIIYNNMITDVSYGIAFQNGDFQNNQILNNSIIADLYSCIEITNGSFIGVEIVNNILSIDGEGNIYWIDNGTDQLGECNYNMYFDKDQIGNYNGFGCSDLVDWQGAGTSVLGNDSVSLVGDPLFRSLDDLHITPTSHAIDSGKPITVGEYGIDITTDIDGQPRDGVEPTIGADEVLPPLSGPSYTIGAGQDFETVTSSFQRLYESGISGPVTFLLTDTEYFEGSIEIDSIYGSSISNQVILKPSTGINSVINFHSSDPFTFAFLLNDIDYFTIDGSNDGTSSRNLQLVASDSMDFGGFIIYNPLIGGDGANYNTIKNLEIIGNKYGSAEHNGIMLNENSNLNSNYTNIENVVIRGVNTGIAASGSSTITAIGNKFINNEIGDTNILNYLRKYGIRATGQDSLEIIGNDIGQVSDTSFTYDLYGLYLDNIINSEISSNNIHDVVDVSGMLDKRPKGIYFNSDSINPNIIIKNNIINHISSAGSSLATSTLNGIEISSAFALTKGSIKIYNNTINAGRDTTYSMTNPGYRHIGVYINLANDSIIDFRNNTIQLSIGGVGSAEGEFGHAIYSNGQAFPFLYSDNNNYFISNYMMPYIGNSDGSDYSTLSEWQTFTNQDANSLSIEPRYISENDAHMQSFSIYLDGAGQPLGDVPNDIDGELRDPSTPDIGADEYEAVKTLFGHITTDTLLQDTVYISDTVWIDNGVTVQIDPGTIISALGPYPIHVEGRLLAEGNTTDSILFTSYDTTGLSDYTHQGWGIVFDSTALSNDSSKFSHCIFEYGGGNGDLLGGAIQVTYFNKVLITNSFFRDNGSENGGAIFVDTSDITISNSIFSNNYAVFGGAIFQVSNKVKYINNIICNNEAGNGGGLLIWSDDSSLLINNTIVNNYATNTLEDGIGGGLQLEFPSHVQFYNNIIWGNFADYAGNQIHFGAMIASPSFFNNDIEGGSGGFDGAPSYDAYDNNIDSDPIFVNPSAGFGRSYDGSLADWSLKDSSMCINLGKADFNTDSLFGIDVDIAGNPRFITRIDMGAYESFGMPVPGNAISFNVADSQYVVSSFDSTLNPTEFTIACWAKVDTLSTSHAMIIGKTSGSFDGFMLMQTDAGDWLLNLGDGVDWNNGVKSDEPIIENQWYHLAVTFDGSLLSLYVNGHLKDTSIKTYVPNTNKELTIGNVMGYNYYFNGQIDELGYWNVAFSDVEIANIINSPLGNDTSNRLLYYNFDRLSDTILPDLSLNGFDGALINMGDTSWVESFAIIQPVVD
ncbi:LamG-like jellyroll fold domain-containing protein, partial [Bacteroidota bacterium]